MKWICLMAILAVAVGALPGVPVLAGDESQALTAAEAALFADDEAWDQEEYFVADPLESVNRLFFQFNDKLYFWCLKPVSQVYGKILPQDIRLCIRNAFDNFMTPVRLVNNLLQGKAGRAGTEISRFVINTTVGIGGLGDPARQNFGLLPAREDFGQTLAVHGAGPGFYLNWPLLGPSNLRDTAGYLVDRLVDPLTYLTSPSWQTVAAVQGTSRVNETSLTLGNYELFTDTALDPYAAVRDAYQQHRQGSITDEK